MQTDPGTVDRIHRALHDGSSIERISIVHITLPFSDVFAIVVKVWASGLVLGILTALALGTFWLCFAAALAAMWHMPH